MIVEGKFGPWEPGLAEAERAARFRELRALATVYVGPQHPLTLALGLAVLDAAAAAPALEELGTIPALTRRRLLSTYGALPGTLARRRGGDANQDRRTRRDEALRDLARLIGTDLSLEERAARIIARAAQYRPLEADQDGGAQRQALHRIAESGLPVPGRRQLRRILDV